VPNAPASFAVISRKLLDRVMGGYRLDPAGIHGPGHWRRVRANGLALAARTEGADHEVIELFALLHDSRRIDDDEDPDHGDRAAALVHDLATDALLALDAARVALLAAACARHALGDVSQDPTIGCCWDADRLELSRLHIRLRDRYLSTAAARDPDLQHIAWVNGSTLILVPAAPGWPLPRR
jgi:uncharacterized protein